MNSSVTYAVQSPVRGLERNTTVNALIDVDTNWWNRSLEEGIFLAEEAKKICGMALSPLKQADKLVWVGNKNGEFSVKSAYHLARSRQEMEGATIIILWGRGSMEGYLETSCCKGCMYVHMESMQ